MATITLTLPERTLEQAEQAAAALNRSVEEVPNEILAAALPGVNDAPADMQAELARMTWLDSPALWDLAQSQMSAEAQGQIQQLSHLQGQRTLTPAEHEQLDQLREE